MILGLFKDKETIQLSKDLAVTFLEAKRALMGLPKNKLNEKNIVSALGPMVNYPTVHSVTVEKLAININIKHKDLQHIQKYQNDYDSFFTDGYDSVMTLLSTESFTWDTQNELNVCNARLIGSIVNLEKEDLKKLGIKNFIEFKDKINVSADQRFDYMLNLIKAMQ